MWCRTVAAASKSRFLLFLTTWHMLQCFKRQKLLFYGSIFHPTGPRHQTRIIDFRYSTCACSVSKCVCINLHPPLHSNVVSLWWYQRVQLCLVGSLSLVHRGDSQHDQIVIANNQFWAVPMCFYLTERAEYTSKYFISLMKRTNYSLLQFHIGNLNLWPLFLQN